MRRTTLIAGPLPLAYTDSGMKLSSNRTFLALHDGAGPASIRNLVAPVSAAPNHRCIVPVRPSTASLDPHTPLPSANWPPPTSHYSTTWTCMT